MSLKNINTKSLTIEEFKELLKLARVGRGYHNKTQKFINLVHSKFGDKIADIVTDVICDEDKTTDDSLQEQLQFSGIQVVKK